jgi:hypothetical protein
MKVGMLLAIAMSLACVKHEPGIIVGKRYFPANSTLIMLYDVAIDMPMPREIEVSDSWIIRVRPDKRAEYECEVDKATFDRAVNGCSFYCD